MCNEILRHSKDNRLLRRDVVGTAVHGAIGCGQRSFMLMWWFHQLLSGFLASGHLSHVSCLSVNKGKKLYETWGCAQISWHLPFGWGKLWETSAKRPSEEDVWPVIATNRGPYLHMTSVGSNNKSGRNREGRKGWEKSCSPTSRHAEKNGL